MICLSANMYRQISKCTDKTPKKHYWGGGGSCPPPPPLATLVGGYSPQILVGMCRGKVLKKNGGSRPSSRVKMRGSGASSSVKVGVSGTGLNERKEIVKIMVSGMAKNLKWWCSGAEYCVICGNDILRIGNLGLIMGGLSRGTYPICIHMEVLPPPPPSRYWLLYTDQRACNKLLIVTCGVKKCIFNIDYIDGTVL